MKGEIEVMLYRTRHSKGCQQTPRSQETGLQWPLPHALGGNHPGDTCLRLPASGTETNVCCLRHFV